jgi:hypothetical protein
MTRVALVGFTQAVTPMGTGIEEGLDAAVGLPHDKHFIFAHESAHEIAGFRDLAFVREEDPAAGENPLEFRRVNIRIDVDGTPLPAAPPVDQGRDIEFRTVRGHYFSTSWILRERPGNDLRLGWPCRRESV